MTLVVPLYNERMRLSESGPHLIDYAQTLPVGSRLLLVDDGSQDDTLAIARRLQALHPLIDIVAASHRGKGAALTTGLEAADNNLIGFCDVDLATPIDELDRLRLSSVTSGALVIGSRGPGATIVRPESKIRTLLGKLFNLAARVMLTPGIRDTQCGAKFAPKSVWDEVLPYIRETGFAWDLELVAVALTLNIPVIEIPVVWRHDARSRVSLLSDGIDMAFALLRIRRRLSTHPRIPSHSHA